MHCPERVGRNGSRSADIVTNTLTVAPTCPNQQGRVAEQELSTQSLREMFREKEKEIEGIMKDLRKQQADGHR